MTTPLFDPGDRMSFSQRVTLQTFTGNGRLAVVTNAHAPTVTLVGMVQGGTAMVPDGRFSVPAITATMLDRGTTEFSRMGLARELEDHGLQLDIRSSGSAPASVSFIFQGLAEELPRMAHILASVLRRPTFPEEELEKVRERVLGILQHERQETASVAFGQLSRMIYPPGHPQRRREIDEREAEVRSITRDDLEFFHAGHYGGRSLVCAVVGDVEEDSARQLLGEALFDWGADQTALPTFPEGMKETYGRIDTDLPDRPNLDIYLGHASSLLLGDNDYPAAVLANACLGQSTLTSRLGVAVRDEAGLTYGINSSFLGTIQIPGPWVVSLSVGSKDLERALALCRQVLEDFLESGPNEAELEDERLAWAGAYKVGLATNAGVAMEVVKTLLSGQDISRLDHFPNEVLTVNRKAVTQALRKHIDPDRLAISVAGTIEG